MRGGECAEFFQRTDGENFSFGHVAKRDIARIRRKTAFVFQNYNLFRNKTALQNVTEGLITARKIPRTQAEETGRAMLESRPGQALPALVVALLAGGISLWLMAWLFKAMKKMQSDGTARLDKAVGLEGSVYLTIPANDVGKVQIAVNGRLNVLDARAAGGQTLPTGARVKVVRIVNGNVLEVESA